MKNIPTISVVHNWRNKKNISNAYSVHLRVTIDRKQKYIEVPIPLKIAANQWSGQDNIWVKKTHPFSFEINCKIQEQRLKLNDLIKRYYMAGKAITFQMIFSELKIGGSKLTFNEFFSGYIKNPTDQLEPDTLKKYEACLIHLNNFNSKINFHDLDPELIEVFLLLL